MMKRACVGEFLRGYCAGKRRIYLVPLLGCWYPCVCLRNLLLSLWLDSMKELMGYSFNKTKDIITLFSLFIDLFVYLLHVSLPISHAGRRCFLPRFFWIDDQYYYVSVYARLYHIVHSYSWAGQRSACARIFYANKLSCNVKDDLIPFASHAIVPVWTQSREATGNTTFTSYLKQGRARVFIIHAEPLTKSCFPSSFHALHGNKWCCMGRMLGSVAIWGLTIHSSLTWYSSCYSLLIISSRSWTVQG